MDLLIVEIMKSCRPAAPKIDKIESTNSRNYEVLQTPAQGNDAGTIY